MKLYDYDFREYERKFVIVSKTGNLLKELKKKPFITEDNESIDLNDLKEPFYGYIFIDNEEGITLRILGNDKTQRKYAKDVELLIRYNAFRDADFEYIIPEELDYSYDIINEYDELFYENESLLNVRGKEELDDLRDEENPDILEVSIHYDNGDSEYLDALTVESFEEEETIIVAKLLEDSEELDNLKKGQHLGLVYVEEELRIKYMLEAKTEEEQEEYYNEQRMDDVDKFNADDEDYE